MIRWSLSLSLVALIGCASPGRTSVAPNEDLIALKQEIVALKNENATLRNRLGHLESEVLASKSEGEFTTMTIDSVRPSRAGDMFRISGTFRAAQLLACHVVEWDGYGRMLRFTRKADSVFFLEAPGHEAVEARMAQGGECNDTGSTRATLLQVPSGKLEPGVEYTLRARNEAEGYTWEVADGVRVVASK